MEEWKHAWYRLIYLEWWKKILWWFYLGGYFNDKKQGYGIYVWADKRKYEGWWYQGKQFGLGIYHIPDGYINIEEPKYGIWEQGKRINWFSAEQVKQIENENLDISTFFQLKTSKNLIQKDQKFECPEGFTIPQEFFAQDKAEQITPK